MSFSKSDFTKLLEACDRLSHEERLHLLKHLTNTDSGFSVLLEICDRLSNEKKGKLFKHLIGKDSSLSVTLGNSPFNANTIYQANTVYQINISNKEQVGDILRMLASIIEKDNVDFES